jgi:hypothetical protein
VIFVANFKKIVSRKFPSTKSLPRLRLFFQFQGSAACFQGCQIAFFQIKNYNLGKFWRALQWKMLVYVMDVWYILRPFAIFYGQVYFVVIWYFAGNLYQKKSGNPARFPSCASFFRYWAWKNVAM